MAVVVRADRLDGGGRIVNGRECEQAAPRGQRRAEPGVLGDYRPAGGEVGRASIAEPAGPQPDVLVLRHGELGARPAEVVAIRVEILRDLVGIDYVPSV